MERFRVPRLRRSAGLLAAALVLAACGRGAPTAADRAQTAPGPPPPASATPSGGQGRCTPAAARCVDDVTAEACSADGQRRVIAACGAGSLCLEGRCVSLAVPAVPGREGGAPSLTAARLYAMRGEGWLNAWGAAGPLAADTIEPLVARPSGALSGAGALERRALCAAGGFVTALDRPDEKPSQPRYALLGGYVVSGQRRDVVLKAGVRGGARIFVNDAQALSVRQLGRRAPFQDESIANAVLGEGVNPVVVIVEQADQSAAGLWLRIRDRRGEAIPDLLFAPAVDAACATEALVDVQSTLQPTGEGFAVDITARLRGLSPRGLGDLERRAELLDASGKALGEPDRGRFDAAALTGSGATVTVPAPLPRAGKYEVALRIGEAPQMSTKIPLVYRGELHRRIVALAGRLDTIPWARLPEASRDSFTWHVQALVRALGDNHPDVGWLRERTRDAEKIADALARGKDAYRAKTGVVFRAYRSRLNGALSPYPVFVPPSYKPDGPPLPLVIAFHGLNNPPEIALRTVIGAAPDKDESRVWAARHLPPFPDQRAILAAPSGFGNAGQRHLGEDDVLAVIEQMKAHYRVDPRRVSITGYSMGGTVSFVVPLHYPDLFSASAPLCGYPNFKQWHSVRDVPHAPWEDRLIEQRSIVNYAENGLYLPLNVVHGGRDGPERSKVIVDRYRKLGYSVKFDVQDELDHNVWDYGYKDGRMITWLKRKQRPAAPARVRLVTGAHRYDRSYWVRLYARRDDAAFAEIDARWRKDDHRIEVTTRNVEAFALDLAALQDGAKAEIVVDGQAAVAPGAAPPGGAAYFVVKGGAWANVPEEPSLVGRKRPGVSGPLDDVQRHPQLIVYGTLDRAQIEVNRMVAAHFSSFDTWAGAKYPMKPDTGVNDEDLTGKSLVLIGGPSSNSVTALFADALPVRFEAEALVLRGKRYEGDGVGVSLIVPHPRDPAEYVVLHAGVGFKGTLYSRHLPRLLPDYVVYDARIATQKGGTLMENRVALDGGFFDERWR